ncbi:MAG: hypothetical protein GKS00_27900 [Alphaproteobacteria bacterium]|nr:hypothetical protein [Alphaproteobacteria bacterium]
MTQQNALETERSWDGNDVQVRTLFDMNAFAEREAASHLDILHYYWSSLQIEKVSLPKVHEFHPSDVLPKAAFSSVGWVDSIADDPRDFVMRDHPENPVYGLGIELNDTFLSEFPNKMHAKSLLLEYIRCKRWKVPLYHEIEQVIGGISRHYTRLMLPLVDESGTVTQIFYGVSPLTPPTPLFIED